MKSSWQTKKLGEICIIVKGKKPRAFSKTGTPYLTAKTIRGSKEPKFTEEREKVVLVEPDDIVIIMDGSNSGEMFQNLSGVLASTMGILTFDKVRFDTRFILYFLISYREEFTQFRTGAAIPHLNKDQFNDLLFPLISLTEQKRIVKILDEAFKNLEIAKNNAEKNLANAKELFESYLQNVFKKGGNDWEEKEWGDLCHFIRGPFGGNLKKSMFVDDGYVVYEQKHAIHDHYNQLRYFLDEKKFNEMKRFEVKPGDIIMSCSGVTLGKVSVIPENIKKGIINQALLKLTPSESINVNFLKHWLRSKVFQDIIFEHSGGAAIPNVPAAKILKKIMIPVPSIKEQKEVVESIESMLSETKKLEKIYQHKLDDLEELKKSLLQKAFMGEL